MTYDYPTWYIFISILISGLLSFFMYRKNIKTSWKFIFMAFLRFISLSIILIAIGKLMLFNTVVSEEKPKLVLAFDQSESMIVNSDIKTLNSIFDELNKSDFSSKYNIQYLGFGEFVDNIDSLEFSNNRTSFEDLENNLDLLLTDNGRVVIISDGNINKGQNSVFNKKKGYKVDVIGIGDTLSSPEISISKIHFNKKVVVGNNFPLEVFFETRSLSDNIKLEVINKEKVVFSEDITLVASTDMTQKSRHLFFLKSLDKGVHVIKVKLTSTNKEISSERNISVNFVKNKGIVLLKYKYPKPDISLFKRKLVERNYKIIVSNRAIKVDSINKFDFVIDFDATIFSKLNIPRVSVSSKIQKDSNSNISTSSNIKSLVDNKYLKSINIDSEEKIIFLDVDNLWKLNLQEAKKEKNNLDLFFDNLLKEIELLKYIDEFKLIYNDIYSFEENVELNLINTSTILNTINAKAEIRIDGKKHVIDFIDDGGKYRLNLGKLKPNSYSAKVIINNKLFENIRFEVKDINVELMSKGQDVDLLKNIANYQNGKYYDISNYTNLLNELKENTNNKTKSKQEKNNLLEQWWFLFIIPIFLAIEWFLRKRNGLY